VGILNSVADPARHFNADEDPDPACHFDEDADLDPNFQFDAVPDPDPNPSLQIKAQNLKKFKNRLIFHTFWLVICKLMRIRPDPDPIFQFDADPCGSGTESTTLGG
jgi:hypothetical protein